MIGIFLNGVAVRSSASCDDGGSPTNPPGSTEPPTEPPAVCDGVVLNGKVDEAAAAACAKESDDNALTGSIMCVAQKQGDGSFLCKALTITNKVTEAHQICNLYNHIDFVHGFYKEKDDNNGGDIKGDADFANVFMSEQLAEQLCPATFNSGVDGDDEKYKNNEDHVPCVAGTSFGLYGEETKDFCQPESDVLSATCEGVVLDGIGNSEAAGTACADASGSAESGSIMCVAEDISASKNLTEFQCKALVVMNTVKEGQNGTPCDGYWHQDFVRGFYQKNGKHPGFDAEFENVVMSKELAEQLCSATFDGTDASNKTKCSGATDSNGINVAYSPTLTGFCKSA